MRTAEPAPDLDRRLRRRRRPIAASGALALGVIVIAACSADEVKEAAVRDLAVGSWACSPDAVGAGERPFTLAIGDDGTFGATVAPNGAAEDPEARRGTITGTWAIEGGDLAWAFDGVQGEERSTVEAFDALTLDSERFTIDHAGAFEANDGPGDPVDEQEVLIDASSTDSVTLRVPEGDPWTCDRQ